MKSIRFVSILLALLVAVCTDGITANATLNPANAMSIEENSTSDEAAIRELIDGFVGAVRAKDLDRVMAVFSPDIVSFDLVAPLQEVGAEIFRKRWQQLFEPFAPRGQSRLD